MWKPLPGNDLGLLLLQPEAPALGVTWLHKSAHWLHGLGQGFFLGV